MDILIDFSSNNLHFELSRSNAVLAVAGTLLAILSAFLLFRTSKEGAVSYTVEIPDQCQEDWKGTVLDKPSIKVC
jgi:hypothetical protein